MRSSLALAASLAFATAQAATAQESFDFRDGFIADSLAPEFRIFNSDPNRMALVDGEYLLLLTNHDTKNAIEYNSELPEDYAVTVRFATTPEHTYQGTNIRFGDGEFGLNFGFYISCCTSWVFYGSKYLSGERSAYEVRIGRSDLRPYS